MNIGKWHKAVCPSLLGDTVYYFILTEIRISEISSWEVLIGIDQCGENQSFLKMLYEVTELTDLEEALL